MENSILEQDEATEQNIKYKSFVVFKLNNEEFAVSTSQITMVVRGEKITPLPDSQSYVEGVISLKGKVVVVINFKKRFEFNTENAENENSENQNILIVESSEKENFGILVDEVLGVLKIPEQNIKEPSGVTSKNLPAGLVEGVAVLEKRLIVIVDLVNIVLNSEIENSNKQKEKKGT